MNCCHHLHPRGPPVPDNKIPQSQEELKIAVTLALQSHCRPHCRSPSLSGPCSPGVTWLSLKASTVKMSGGSKGPVSQARPGTLFSTSPPPAVAGAPTPLPLGPQMQNLGLFPVHGVMMKITVPIATRSGNRLLMLRDFLTDQVSLPSGAG